jgi:hypothetical protein
LFFLFEDAYCLFVEILSMFLFHKGVMLMPKRPHHIAIFLGLTIILASFSWGSAQAASVFFNEIHYDNTGTDTGEAIEIAGQAGTDLTGWSLVLYNGSNGTGYNTKILAGIITDQQNGFGTLSFSYPVNGIQNGSPDGLALIDASSSVIQFPSYQGSFTAVGGPADGLLSVDIGVAESSGTPIGNSLQLTGSGTDSSDFTWAAAMADTFGAVNTGQTFSGGGQQPVPEPSTIFLLGSGLTGLSFWRWKHRHQNPQA